MHIETRVTIDRPVREVFGLISCPENLPLWASGVSGAERTRPGPVGVGATFEVLRAGGAHKDCWEVIEHEPPRAFAYRRLDGMSFTQCRYTLQNIDGCTGLGLEVYAGAGTSPEPSHLLEQWAQRQLGTDLGMLREVLEGGIGEEGMRVGDAAVRARLGLGPAVWSAQPQSHTLGTGMRFRDRADKRIGRTRRCEDTAQPSGDGTTHADQAAR